MSMHDPKDLGGKVERTGDGLTGHSVGSNPGPGWLSDHSGKLTAAVVLVAVIAAIILLALNG